MQIDLHSEGAKMESELRGSLDLTNRNDYCVALVYLGRGQEAVTLLEQLEKDHPGDYSTAANLGTAYEVAGDNQKALQWIQEDIHRNPDGHMGTEWLHVAILQAKLAQEKDPAYFLKHTVLDLQPDTITDVMTVAGKPRNAEEIDRAIEYQLEERMELVKPPDAAVAALLYDDAAVTAVEKSVQSAKKILQLAIQYGYPPEKIQPLVVKFDRRIYWSKVERYALYSTLIVIAGGILWFLYKKGIFVLSYPDLKPRRQGTF